MIAIILIIALLCLIFCITQSTDVVRRGALNAMWITLLSYPGVFALLNGRAVYGVDSVSPWASLLPVIVALFHAIVISTSLLILALPRTNNNAAPVPLRTGLFFYFGAQLAVIVLHATWSALSGWLVVILVLLVVIQGMEPVRTIEKRIRWALRLYILSSLIAAIVNPKWALVPETSNSRSLFGIDDRLIGFTDSSNYLGLIAAVLFALEIGSTDRNRKVELFFTGLALSACLLSQSRTPLVAIGLICIVAIAKRAQLFKNKQSNSPSWLLIGLSLVSLLPIGVLLFSSQKIQETLQDFTTGRVSIWYKAVSAFIESPLIGQGPEVFSASYWERIGATQEFLNAHNQWLEAVSRGGILELFGLITFLVALLIVVSRVQETNYALMVFSISIIVFMQLPFGTPLRLSGITWNLVVLATLLAISASSLAQARPSESDHEDLIKKPISA